MYENECLAFSMLLFLEWFAFVMEHPEMLQLASCIVFYCVIMAFMVARLFDKAEIVI